MNEKLVEQIKENMKSNSTEELLKIWEKINKERTKKPLREQCSEESFEAIRRLLTEREAFPKKRPFGIRLIAIIWCFAGLIGFIAVIDDINKPNIFRIYNPIEAGFKLILSFSLFVAAYGLWKLRKWGRVSFFIVYILFSLSWLIFWWGIIYIVIGIFSIIYLMKRNIRAIYNK